jgi:hypothetical protein
MSTTLNISKEPRTARLLDNWQEYDGETGEPYRVVIEEAGGRVTLFVDLHEEATLSLTAPEADRTHVLGMLEEHYPAGWADRFERTYEQVVAEDSWSRMLRRAGVE